MNSIIGCTGVPTVGDDDREGPIDGTHNKVVSREYSARDQKTLRDALETVIAHNPNAVIVEIGVHRDRTSSWENSSTRVLFDKPAEAMYVGIDIRDKTGLTDTAKNIHVIRCDSRDRASVDGFLDSIGATKIDLLHIDGHHSVNSVINDWQYVDRLADRGIVVLHDAAVHPGPTALLRVIDRSLYDVHVFHDKLPDDWGIAVVQKKG